MRAVIYSYTTKLRDVDFDAVADIWYRQKPNHRLQWITRETLKKLEP